MGAAVTRRSRREHDGVLGDVLSRGLVALRGQVRPSSFLALLGAACSAGTSGAGYRAIRYSVARPLPQAPRSSRRWRIGACSRLLRQGGSVSAWRATRRAPRDRPCVARRLLRRPHSRWRRSVDPSRGGGAGARGAAVLASQGRKMRRRMAIPPRASRARSQRNALRILPGDESSPRRSTPARSKSRKSRRRVGSCAVERRKAKASAEPASEVRSSRLGDRVSVPSLSLLTEKRPTTRG